MDLGFLSRLILSSAHVVLPHPIMESTILTVTWLDFISCIFYFAPFVTATNVPLSKEIDLSCELMKFHLLQTSFLTNRIGAISSFC